MPHSGACPLSGRVTELSSSCGTTPEQNPVTSSSAFSCQHSLGSPFLLQLFRLTPSCGLSSALLQDPVPLFKVFAEELVSQLKEQQQAVQKQ